MGKIGDTKGGTAGSTASLGRVLPLRQRIVEPTHTDKTESAPDADGDKKPASGSPGAVFDPSPSQTVSRDVSLHDVPAHGGGGVRARLIALGVRRAEDLPIKQTEGVRVKDTPIGKIVDGDVQIENARGFQKLEGVVRVTGDVTVQEAQLAGGEVTPAQTLVEIGGRLTIEGVTS